MSDTFWTGLFAALTATLVPILTLIYQRAKEAKMESQDAKKASEEAKIASKANSETIKEISEKNKEQHIKMNHELDELKRLIKEAAIAEGILQGRKDLKQELLNVKDDTTAELSKKLDAMQSDQDVIWGGIIKRGYVEAEKTDCLLPQPGGGWNLTARARREYDPIAADLKMVLQNLRTLLGREPTDETLSWAIEKKFQDWMQQHACPGLGVNQHGCLAIACVIAREP